MAFAPYKLGLNFIISKKCWEIIKKFRLPQYNLILVKIDTFSANYFSIGFPMIRDIEIDFDKSTFFDEINHKVLEYKSYEEYHKDNHTGDIFIDIVKLKKKYNYDLINLQGKIFISEKMGEEITKNNIIGLRIKKRLK
ncbi:MAG: hypothetical protein LBK27_00625 [Treponema sp.]|nr:hypothetical protein [Treponema sp.]